MSWRCSGCTRGHLDPAAAREHAERTLAVYAEEPSLSHEAVAMMVRAWALAEEGALQEGIALSQVGLERFLATGQRTQLELHLARIAELHLRAGNVTEALTFLTEAEGPFPGKYVLRAETIRCRAALLALQAADPATIEQ